MGILLSMFTKCLMGPLSDWVLVIGRYTMISDFIRLLILFCVLSKMLQLILMYSKPKLILTGPLLVFVIGFIT